MQIVLIGWCSQIDSVVRFQALDHDRLSAFGTGNTTEGSATVSGGNQNLLYSLTGSARGTLGYLKMPDLYRDAYTSLYNKAPDDWMKRPNMYRTWAGTGTITSIPRQGLRLSLTSSLSKDAQRQGSAQDQLSVLATSYIDTVNLGPESLEGYTTRVTSNGVTFTNGVTADWSATERIAVNARAGISTTERDDESYRPFGIIALGGLDTVGKFRMGHGSAESHTAAVNVIYSPLSMIKTTAGLEFHRETTHDFLAVADSLAPGITRPLAFNSANQRSNSLTTAGWFVEPRLNLHSRFFASPGFRFDGGNAAGAHGGVNGGLFSLFPRLDFSWIAVDREGEAPLGGILSLFRPRVAFGVAGVQPDPTWKLRLSALPTLNNALQSSGLFLTSLGNVDLRPERSREFEGGFDMQLWGNRLALRTSYYNKLRIDAITSISVAPSIYGGSAALPFYVNVGRIRNTGIELSADATIIETSAISWQLSAQYSSDNNRLVKFTGDPNLFGWSSTTGDIRFVQGYPVNGRWVRPIVGYNTPAPGQALSIGDVALGDSAVYVGQESPKFQLPVSTALTLWHGKVRVNAVFDFQDGMTQLNQGGTLALAKFALSPTAAPGQQAAALAAACYYASTTAPGCDQIATAYGLIQTVSVLRFNSLSVGYQVPRAITQRLRVPQTSIALQGSNLGLWTNYRGKDPNVTAVTSGESVIDTGILPLPRTWRLSVNFGN
jgi:outer membrane receptor protein involved in Fe transport